MSHAWVWPPVSLGPHGATHAPGGSDAIPGLPPEAPPLPLSTSEYWISDVGLNLSAWVGRLRGAIMSYVPYAPLQGSVAVDGTYFKSLPVAITTRTGGAGAYWTGTGITPPLALTGSQPWCMFVGRCRSLIGATGSFGVLCQTGTRHLNSQPDGNYRGAVYWDSGANPSVPGVEDFKPHKWKWWGDGALAYVKMDSLAPVTATYNGSLQVNMTVVGVGYSGVGICATSAAMVMVCGSKPSAAEESALDAWVLKKYGV